MLALCDRSACDLRMPHVGRGDDDRLYIVALHDVFVIRRGDVDAGLLTRALQGCPVGVAERDDFGFGTQRKAGKMILQRDAAATHDGDADWFHERERRVWRSVQQRQARSVGAITAIDKLRARADCQSAIQPIDNRRYSVAQTGSLLYRRLLTGDGCATTCANFVNGPAPLHALAEPLLVVRARICYKWRCP